MPCRGQQSAPRGGSWKCRCLPEHGHPKHAQPWPWPVSSVVWFAKPPSRPEPRYGRPLRDLTAPRAAIAFSRAPFPPCGGTGFASNAILKWANDRGVEWLYVDPGQAAAERLHRELQRLPARRMPERRRSPTAWPMPAASWPSGAASATTSGRMPRSPTRPRQKPAGRLSNLRAPRPARLPSPIPTTIDPEVYRHERGATGGQVICAEEPTLALSAISSSQAWKTCRD